MKKLIRKQEIYGLVFVLGAIVVITYLNILVSLRKERDIQRNLDVTAIQEGLVAYYKDYGFYPESIDGKIIACKGPDTKIKLGSNGKAFYFTPKANKPVNENLIACIWGEDALLDINDINYPNYLSVIPKDPIQENGASYYYLSNGSEFKIFGAFEGKSQKEYNENVKGLNLKCGDRICNFGKASPGTKLSKPLQ